MKRERQHSTHTRVHVGDYYLKLHVSLRLYFGFVAFEDPSILKGQKTLQLTDAPMS